MVDFILKRRLRKDDHLRHQIRPLSQPRQTGSKNFPPIKERLRIGPILGRKIPVVSPPAAFGWY